MPKTDLSRREALFTVASSVLPAPALPTAKFGPHTISRLIVGGNPVSANSHVSAQLSREMLDYFTTGQVKKLLRDCEQAGINVWQSRGDRHIQRLLHEYRLEGGRIEWIAQTASEYGDLSRNIGEIGSLKPLGIYFHGAATDRHWVAGTIDRVPEALKAIRQTGAMVGLGTHIPEVIDYAEDKGWDVDFYMACVYNLSRSRAEAERLAGRPVGELFWDPDRERMLERVQKTRKPCLIFKVYAATRKCDAPEQMRDALALVFRYAKPSDAVVIGMFPKHTDQIRENCRLVVETGRR
ncbi:MAG TPA: hypothetical protein VN428_15825 [Bryobacteraceae bacterium]|nr:hypothetical protein [Bryobacteraceae bacterium]